jgi:hypothetical protein
MNNIYKINNVYRINDIYKIDGVYFYMGEGVEFGDFRTIPLCILYFSQNS